MTDKIVVLTTCGSLEEAERVARRLVEKKLAACVNIGSPVRSVYRWKDVLETATEIPLTIKSRRALFTMLRQELAAVHSYEVPEVLALTVADGSPDYLSWMDGELLEA